MTRAQAEASAPVSRELEGQAAFVSGGATGIGLAVSRALAARGAAVAIFARNEARAEEAAAAIRTAGGKAQAHAADITDSTSVDAAFGKALEQLGRVDILVNNAGLTRDGLFVRMSDEQWDQVLDTNLAGAFRCSRAVARSMMKARYGRIVNISSVVGLMGNAGQANYAASKAGLLGLTKSLAREVGRRHVRVNAVVPGLVMTGMVAGAPAERLQALRAIEALPSGTAPEDVAATIVFLLSDRARAITGQAILVDAGSTA